MAASNCGSSRKPAVVLVASADRESVSKHFFITFVRAPTKSRLKLSIRYVPLIEVSIRGTGLGAEQVPTTRSVRAARESHIWIYISNQLSCA